MQSFNVSFALMEKGGEQRTLHSAELITAESAEDAVSAVQENVTPEYPTENWVHSYFAREVNAEKAEEIFENARPEALIQKMWDSRTLN